MIIKEILELLKKDVVIKINKPEYMGVKAESVEFCLASNIRNAPEPTEKRTYVAPLDSVEKHYTFVRDTTVMENPPYTIMGDD